MPITTNYKIEKKVGGNYDPIPSDMYPVELLDITEETKPTYNDKTKMENIFVFKFVILKGKDEKDKDLRGRLLFRNFVPSYLYIGKKGKNMLYQVIEALLGRELTLEEEATFETAKLNKLIGKQCRVFIENTEKDGKTYSNIAKLIRSTELHTSLTTNEKEKLFREMEYSKKEEEIIQETDITGDDGLIDVSKIPF